VSTETYFFVLNCSPKSCCLHCAGDAFVQLLDPYLRKALRKGIPPLFIDLRPLYRDQDKAKVIQDTCQGFLDNLRKNGTFSGGWNRE
jgi:peptide alpha-N-acetyltransferase